MLDTYDRVLARVPPKFVGLLRAHLTDLEKKMQPAMLALTWTSMNIDSFVQVKDEWR